MMEARIPTRKWEGYDLATEVARDDKKASRFQGTTEHLEKQDEKDGDDSSDGRVRRFPSIDN